MEFLYYLESIRSPFLDYFFKFWTLFGDETLNFALICLVYWCIDKKLAYKIAFTMFISGMIVQNMKISFRVDRPWIRDPNFTTVEGALDTATGYSFPSGHTQGAASVFGTIALSIKKLHYRILCVFVILMVAMSRMYLGVHTLADVTVGLIIAVIVTVICSFVFDKLNTSKRFDIIITVIFALLSLFTLIFAIILLKNDYIKVNNASDCCKLAGAGLGVAVGLFVERKFVKFDTKEKNIFLQLIKFAVGILIAVGLKSGLKIILGDNFTVDVIRYFITVMWILAIYPLILNKIKK